MTDIWPSNSSDQNFCDYWLFGVIEEESKVTSHTSVNSLKAAIRWAFRTQRKILLPYDGSPIYGFNQYITRVS